MFLIRNAEARDFQALKRLARLLDSYNLPADEKFLRELLRDSKASFLAQPIPEERKRFLFVAEEMTTQNVVGCSLIIARHGTPRLPHISFVVRRERKKSRSLGHFIEHQTLRLSVNRRGFTEIGGLVVLPDYRSLAEHVGKQLAYARFAYMAWFPNQFCRRILVEYLPALDPKKGNKFWEVLGARFTHLGYREADRASARDKEFILSLFPKEKIYCGLLPQSATDQLGIAGPGARGSVHMLEKIGFRYLNQVDPFDGGPHYGAPLKRITIFKKTRFFRYEPNDHANCRTGKRGLVMVVTAGTARALVADYVPENGRVLLAYEIADLLKLQEGERVSVTPLDL